MIVASESHPTDTGMLVLGLLIVCALIVLGIRSVRHAPPSIKALMMFAAALALVVVLIGLRSL